MKRPRFRRIVLKLSGEALTTDGGYGIDAGILRGLAEEIRGVRRMGVETSVVVGGGNIFRGLAGMAQGFDRATGDYMGMLATVINALALQSALEGMGVPTRVLTAIEMRSLAEPYIRRRAVRHLEKGRVVIFAAGTGNPYFTTDTAAALRAMEIQADSILKATKVEGVFDADPKTHRKARLFRRLSYLEVLQRGLKVMDAAAISLCMDHRLPIHVFNVRRRGNLRRVILGERVGTEVCADAASEISERRAGS